MIELPTRRRLERRRDRLYKLLGSIVTSTSVHNVEGIMRQIHAINLRLRTYFKAEFMREPKEIFIDQNEDNDITTQDPSTGEISPTLQDIAQIEAEINEGKIQVRDIRD
jgi:hypothetical protein